jgi:transcriptional regulator with XRE-family HTH domain
MKENRASIRFGKIVRQMRKERNWSQLDLADELGTDAAYISRIELGMKNLSLETLMRLAKVFSVKMSFGDKQL